MVFEEQYFCKLINGLDCSEENITKVANYMLKYLDNYQTIVKIWNHFFNSTKSSDLKLALFYLSHEVMFQNYIDKSGKSDTYIIAFGTIMEDIINVLIKTFGEELDFINNLLKIIEFWEKKMYFSINFIDKLKNNIYSSRKKIYENDPKLQLYESIRNEDIKKVIKNDLTKQGLEMSIEQSNIKRLNEQINYGKINSLLVDKDIDDNKKREIKKYEMKLKALRQLLITDLVKREKYVLNLADNLMKEKETYFELVKQTNKEKEKD